MKTRNAVSPTPPPAATTSPPRSRGTGVLAAALAITLASGATWAATGVADPGTAHPQVRLAATTTLTATTKPCEPGWVWSDDDGACILAESQGGGGGNTAPSDMGDSGGNGGSNNMGSNDGGGGTSKMGNG